MSHFKNESLDWIYIDALHTYGASLRDMQVWYSKLKPGGLFSGDDYGDSKDTPYLPEEQYRRSLGTFARDWGWGVVRGAQEFVASLPENAAESDGSSARPRVQLHTTFQNNRLYADKPMTTVHFGTPHNPIRPAKVDIGRNAHRNKFANEAYCLSPAWYFVKPRAGSKN